MKNWSVDIKKLQKDKEKFAIWRFEQMINYGTDGEKIHAANLKKYWRKLILDPDKKLFLGFLLWGKKYLAKNS